MIGEWGREEPAEPGGLADGAQARLADDPAVVEPGAQSMMLLTMLGELTTRIVRAQLELEALRGELTQHWRESVADRAALRLLVEAHGREELPRLRLIQARLNLMTGFLLAVGLFALAGSDGLRQIGEFVTRDGSLGFDGIATIAGLVIPALYPLGRRLFLRVDRQPEETDNG